MDPLVAAALLSGIALLLGTGLTALFNSKLNAINHAVNHKEPDEPTLREVAVSTSDVVVSLAEKVGQLSEKLDKQGVALTEHTAQDASNFKEILERMESINEANQQGTSA